MNDKYSIKALIVIFRIIASGMLVAPKYSEKKKQNGGEKQI